MFCTVLNRLKSPTNVGMIVRSHVAFGGQQVVFIGDNKPWEFRKGSQSFSRKLEAQCELIFLPDDDAFFSWAAKHDYQTVAIEIDAQAKPLHAFDFPARAALIVGHEAFGIAPEFLARCDHSVFIPQFGAAACLNVAVSCSIAQYECTRGQGGVQTMNGAKFVDMSARD
jgi:23S rRNA (guanosine2251-2'-O)-methyltransferase